MHAQANSDAAQSPRIARGRRSAPLVAAMAGLSAVNYFDRSILAIAAPVVIHEFHISEVAMGAAFSAFLLSYTALLTPGGWLADLAGPRRVLAWACAAWAVFTAATALAGTAVLAAIPAITALVAIRFILGATSAPLYPACTKLVASVIAPARVTAVQGFVVSFSAVGSAVAPFLFIRLMDVFGWRGAFCAAGAITAIVAGAWAASTRRLGAASAETSLARRSGLWRAVLSNPSLLWLSASYFCVNYFEYIFFYWMYYYFGQIRHFPATLAAAASTTTMLGMVAFGPLGGWIADVAGRRYGFLNGRRYVAVSGMLLSAVLLYLGASGFSAITTIALLTLAFGCVSASEGPFWATAAITGGEYAGAAGGFMNTVGNVGGMIAPVLTPAVAARFGWTAALSFASAVVLAGVFAWAGVRATDARQWPGRD